MDADQRIRQTMREELTSRGWTQQQLADQIGISKSAMAQLLGGSYGKIPGSLLQALDALGLELIAQPKQGRH